MAATRSQARQAVLSGRVLVSGAPADKPGRMVAPAEPIAFTVEQKPYVGRGAYKLEGALDAFGIDVSGGRCLDLGASTGGFTDVLLQRGAAGVVAVDVGTNQLDYSLRQNPRVTVMERTDLRDLDPDALGPFDLIVADLSFISLRTVMPHIAALARDAWVIVLVKPQFEVGRANVGKGGVVRDLVLQGRAVEAVVEAAAEHALARVDDAESPIAGADGNREFFVLLKRATRTP